MVDVTILEKLIERNGEYNFTKLVDYMLDTGFVYKDRKLKGPLAIATLNGVLLDMSVIDRYHDKLIYFILLHEIGHMKRIARMGKDLMLANLSIEDFDEFTAHIFEEEIFADRYACRLFYHFNKEIYPWYETQQLNLKYKQEQYGPMARMYYGKIQNNEEKYNEMINNFIVY
jgi:hypothetical protein